MTKYQTYQKKRLSIIIEMPYLKRLLHKLEDMDVPGYTVLPAIAGSGRNSNWRADSLSSDTGQMAQVVLVVDEDYIERILDEVYKVLKSQIGIVSISDVEVLRDDHF